MLQYLNVHMYGAVDEALCTKIRNEKFIFFGVYFK